MLDISNFPWAECVLTDKRIINAKDSISLRRRRRSKGLLRYEFELTTIDMPTNQGRSIKAKLSKATDDTLLFVHPRFSYAQGVIPPLGLATSGSTALGSDVVSITSHGEAWSLLAGDYIQFSNDTKVYEVAEDTVYGSGAKSVTLTSELRKATVNGGTVIANDVTWYLYSDGEIEVGMDANDNQDMELTIITVERL